MNNQSAQDRFSDARRLAEEGKPAEALAIMLSCFDGDMKFPSPLGAVRLTYLPREIARLGASYPPALQALRERRDQARKDLEDEPGNFNAWSDFVALNRALGEEAQTLEFYDEIDKRGGPRPRLSVITREFLAAGRFAEAVVANPLSAFLEQFDRQVHFMNTHPEVQGDGKRAGIVAALAMKTGRELEALLGIKDLAGAQTVIAKMFEIDRSASTLATLRVHAIRAGHPDLISAN